MLEILKKYRKILYVLLPLLLGLMINEWMLLLHIYVYFIWVINICFVIYWFWIGKQFALIRFNKILNFLLGNIIWGISLALYIWQFVCLDDSSRSMFMAGLSQHYGLFTLTFAGRIVMLYEDVIDSTQVMILSYILMLIIYSLGFIYGIVRLSNTNRNNSKEILN